MGHADFVAHDPSAPSGHLPGFAREDNAEVVDCANYQPLSRTSPRQPHAPAL